MAKWPKIALGQRRFGHFGKNGRSKLPFAARVFSGKTQIDFGHFDKMAKNWLCFEAKVLELAKEEVDFAARTRCPTRAPGGQKWA